MVEFHALRALLGTMQIGVVLILLKNDIGYLFRFGLAMFASAITNLAPAHPNSTAWQQFVQVPAYAVLFILTAEATLEIFAFLRRRTFIEERSALLTAAGVIGFIPVWICWKWPGDDWYQSVMLARQCALMWLAAAYIFAWSWLRAIRPIHMELKIADHGEFWAFWLLSAATHASTTKYGLIWRFAEWQGNGYIWRLAGDLLLLGQISICFGFALNLWKWRTDDAVDSQDEKSDLHAPPQFRPRRLIHL